MKRCQQLCRLRTKTILAFQRRSRGVRRSQHRLRRTLRFHTLLLRLWMCTSFRKVHSQPPSHIVGGEDGDIWLRWCMCRCQSCILHSLIVSECVTYQAADIGLTFPARLTRLAACAWSVVCAIERASKRRLGTAASVGVETARRAMSP